MSLNVDRKAPSGEGKVATLDFAGVSSALLTRQGSDESLTKKRKAPETPSKGDGLSGGATSTPEVRVFDEGGAVGPPDIFSEDEIYSYSKTEITVKLEFAGEDSEKVQTEFSKFLEDLPNPEQIKSLAIEASSRIPFQLPTCVKRFKNLQEITITELDHSLTEATAFELLKDFKALKKINLGQYCQLDHLLEVELELDDQVLEQLTELKFYFFKPKKLEEILVKTKNLKTLSLEKLELECFPVPAGSSFKQLTHLSLSENDFEDFPDFKSIAPKCKHIEFSYNKFRVPYDCKLIMDQ